jgi:hypothetical protein
MKLLKFLSSAVVCLLMLATAAPAKAADREHYILKTYTLKPAKQAALDDYLSKAYIPAAKRLGAGPVGVFREPEANGLAVVHVLTVLKSAAQASELEAGVAADAAYKEAARSFLSATAADPAYDKVETSVLAAIEGVPSLVKPDTTKPRLLNLRIYESPNPAAHEKKVEMFNTGELAIFKRSGLTPVMFGSAISGPRMPNLTYFLVFSDDEARKAAWKKFGSDPEWQVLKAKPGFTDKEIITKITNILLTPAPYSEI